MNISSISSLTHTLSTQNSGNSLAANFNALATALQNGNLAGAQSAFAALQKGQAQSASATQMASSTQTQGSSPIQKDFAALQTALQQGNLTGAQTAFATLKQDLQSLTQNGAAGQSGDATGVTGHHHHHHQVSDAAGTPAAATSSRPEQATSSTTPAISGSILNVTA